MPKSPPPPGPREVAQVGKFAPAEKSEESKKRKNGDHQRSPETNNKKAKNLDQRVLRPPSSKYTNFTEPIGSREKVFLVAK